MNGDGGYSYTSAALTDIAGTLRSGSQDLGAAGRNTPPGPDAGISSTVVGSALATLVQVAATAQGVLEDAANKIHAAKGSYGDTENTAAAGFARQQDNSEDQQNFRGTDYGSAGMAYPG